MAKKVTKKTSKVNTTRKLTGDAAKQREKSDKEKQSFRFKLATYV